MKDYSNGSEATLFNIIKLKPSQSQPQVYRELLVVIQFSVVGEVDYDLDFPFSLEEHSPTPIMASQSPLTSITPMDGSESAGINRYSTEWISYMNDILLIDITNSLFVYKFCGFN